MTTTRTKRNAEKITEAPAPAELEVQELDPPDPAIMRWQELVAPSRRIEHEGNAENIIPFPRPAWAHPDFDETDKGGLSWTSYNSDTAFVRASRMGGEPLDGVAFLPSGLNVRARCFGDGWAGVGISMFRYLKDQWVSLGCTLTLDEARQLIETLTAATNMIEGVQ